MTRKDLANIFKEKREKKNLTQAEVAKKAGLNTNYYAVIERGEINPSFETFNKICNALGLTLSLH